MPRDPDPHLSIAHYREQFPTLFAVAQRLGEAGERIDAARLMVLTVQRKMDFSFGSWSCRSHAYLELRRGDEAGYGENIVSVNVPDERAVNWREALQPLQGLALDEALAYVLDPERQWPQRMREAVEMAVIDLIGKRADVTALELLGMAPTREQVAAAVPRVHVILTRQTELVARGVEAAIAAGLEGHIKLKLFGEPELDQALVRTARTSLAGRTSTLIGDANGAYLPLDEGQSLPDDIAAQVEALLPPLLALRRAGLDALEDPVIAGPELWAQLQRRLNESATDGDTPLALIPDEPMRPARTATRLLRPDMGRIFNVHPGCMESLLDAIGLARAIRQAGRELMIGDDSLTGPATTVWQQLALALGARWVEATRKEGDSDVFDEWTLASATDDRGGRVLYTPRPGFGLVMRPFAPLEPEALA